jgi:hypothetical protein
MGLVGEEKRIRALFRELRLEDERLTPQFATVWSAAQPETATRRGGLSLSFATVAALVVCLTAFSLAVLWRYEKRVHAVQSYVATTPANPSVSPTQVERDLETTVPPAVDQRPVGPSHRLRAFRFAARRRAELLAERQLATREAIAISSWQSPTADLLRIPGDEILRSLPQLADTADELKSLLTNN